MHFLIDDRLQYWRESKIIAVRIHETDCFQSTPVCPFAYRRRRLTVTDGTLPRRQVHCSFGAQRPSSLPIDGNALDDRDKRERLGIKRHQLNDILRSLHIVRKVNG